MIEIAKPDRLDPTMLFQQMVDAGFEGRTDWLYADQDETGMGTIVRFLHLEEADRPAVEAIFATHTAEVVAEEERVVVAEGNKKSIEQSLADALAQNQSDRTENDVYLAKATPTANEQERHIKTLTRQSTRQARYLNMLIRIQQGNYSGTE